jgi:hypothetical protein
VPRPEVGRFFDTFLSKATPFNAWAAGSRIHDESFKLRGSHRRAAVAACGARLPFAETFMP